MCGIGCDMLHFSYEKKTENFVNDTHKANGPETGVTVRKLNIS